MTLMGVIVVIWMMFEVDLILWVQVLEKDGLPDRHIISRDTYLFIFAMIGSVDALIRSLANDSGWTGKWLGMTNPIRLCHEVLCS